MDDLNWLILRWSYFLATTKDGQDEKGSSVLR